MNKKDQPLTLTHNGKTLEVYKQAGKNKAKGLWRFRIKTKNHELLNDSYTSRQMALKGFKTLMNAMFDFEDLLPKS